MNRGYDTVKGWLDIAEVAYCDGEVKTAKDLTREAYASFLLFRDEIPADLRRECAQRLQALKRLLNEGYAPKPTLH